MASKSGIAIAGSIIVDKLNEISSYPASGELTKILSLSKAVGGCVSNTSIDIKRIDASIPVKSLGKIGNDHDGDFLVETLLKNGVDVSLLTRGDNPTSFTDVMSVVGGQRTFFAFPGACDDFGYDDIDFEKDEEWRQYLDEDEKDVLSSGDDEEELLLSQIEEEEAFDDMEADEDEDLDPYTNEKISKNKKDDDDFDYVVLNDDDYEDDDFEDDEDEDADEY